MSENLIQQIVKESASIPLTTLVRTLNLRPEAGSTQVSLNNLSKIKESPLSFNINSIVFYAGKHPRLHTEWVSKDDDVVAWDFRGLKDPENLVSALKTLGIKDWDIDTVQNLKPAKYKIL